jgi:pectinesterase
MQHKTMLAMLVICGLIGSLSHAQTPAFVNWKCAPPDSQKVSAIGGNLLGLPEIGAPGFEVRDYTSGPGPDQRWWPINNTWLPASGPTDTLWVQFAVYPEAYHKFHADSITLYMGAKGTGNLRAKVFYATTAAFTDSVPLCDTAIYLVKDDHKYYNFAINTDIAAGDTLFIRIYPWLNQTSIATGKYLYLLNATVWGFTEKLAISTSAYWALSDPNTGGTGKTVVTSGPITAEEELLFNTEINQYTGPQYSQRVRIKGNAWPANQLTQIDSVYIQFAAAPKPGVLFKVKKVALKIGAASINTMKANIYYATNPAFSDSILIPYQTKDTVNNYLNIDTLTQVELALDTIVNPNEQFYLRIYPWVHNDPNVRTGKYVCLQDVLIAGEAEGTIVINLPTVTTAPVTWISTSSASSGGTISDDGGAPVTARGICWNTTGAPTIADNKTDDGTGSGSFESRLVGLTKGTTYYVRAYATNAAGTGYGDEVIFQTLDSLNVPTVVTAPVTNILVKTAQCGGNVTDWGGDTVTVRGVCWNTTGNPTTNDSKTENGSGLGNFTSILYPLVENTTYYVRAYAVNSVGTGYGEVVTFTTQSPAPDVFKIVAKDGSGDYTSVQAAFNAIPDFYTGRYIIYVKKGLYYEKLLLDRNKTNVILIGEDRDNTILTYDDYAGKVGGTSNSYSVAIDADDFVAMNITFQNTVKNDGTFNDQQAVALRVNGDRQAYYNCKLLGYQDTYYTWGGRVVGRIYMHQCYIEGSVDFIFGRDIVVFDTCEIHINRNGGTLTAASTEANTQFGYVFRDCKITADSLGFNGVEITQFYLGRPWQAAPRTVFIRCEEPATLAPAGWMTWNVTPALYAEYQCFGPGADYSQRLTISRQLTDEEAQMYTLKNIFAKTTNPNLAFDWLPIKPEVIIPEVAITVAPPLPESYRLFQNYPNPFNPNTTIKYNLPEPSQVSLIVYNLLGKQVLNLVNTYQPAGYYSVNLDASALPSGIYFYRLDAGHFHQTRKMSLIK